MPRCRVENVNIMSPINNNIMADSIIATVTRIGVNSQPLQNDIQLCAFIEPPSPYSPTNDKALLPMFHASYFSEFKLDEAWGCGNIACSQRPMSSSGWKEFKILMLMFTCTECCFYTGHHSITVGNDRYIKSIHTTTNWYNGVFISSFAQLASHYAHITCNERNGVTIDMTMVIHVTFQKKQLEVSQYKALPDGVTRVVAIMHYADQTMQWWRLLH